MYIFLVIVVAFILYLFVSKQSRAITRAGKKGEKILYKKLRKSIKKGSVILRNVELPLYDGITEIDLLVVTQSGIVIIENKHLSGNIYGDTKSQNWIQDKNGNIKEFYNPIKQNYGHFKCLLHHLKKNKIYGVNITSIVIFSHEAGNLQVSDPFVHELESGVMAVKKLSSIKGNLDVNELAEKLKKMAKKYK